MKNKIDNIYKKADLYEENARNYLHKKSYLQVIMPIIRGLLIAAPFVSSLNNTIDESMKNKEDISGILAKIFKQLEEYKNKFNIEYKDMVDILTKIKDSDLKITSLNNLKDQRTKEQTLELVNNIDLFSQYKNKFYDEYSNVTAQISKNKAKSGTEMAKSFTKSLGLDFGFMSILSDDLISSFSQLSQELGILGSRYEKIKKDIVSTVEEYKKDEGAPSTDEAPESETAPAPTAMAPKQQYSYKPKETSSLEDIADIDWAG